MTDKPKWLNNAIDFLIDNFTVLATIAYATFVLYQREVAKSTLTTDELIAAILAVLGLLAVSEVVERYRKLSSIDRANKRILSLVENQHAERPSALAFFQKEQSPILDVYTQSANSIDMCGITLTSAINKQFGNIRERLKQGASVRLLIIDPDSLALQMSSLRSESPDDVEYHHKRLMASLEDVKYLYKSWKENQSQQGQNSKKGSFSVHLLAYAPSFGIYAFDTSQPNGAVIVEIYPHKSGFKSPPIFNLTAQRDGQWYKYFIGQFEEMWAAAKEWQPKSP
ncbi:MAG: hypothetical protein AB1817_18505 [Chloroflexota bacterium]